MITRAHLDAVRGAAVLARHLPPKKHAGPLVQPLEELAAELAKMIPTTEDEPTDGIS